MMSLDGPSSNGRTPVFGTGGGGSNPPGPTLFRRRRSGGTPRLLAVLLAGIGAPAPVAPLQLGPLESGAPPSLESPPDSAELRARAEGEQGIFERTRVRYAPRAWGSYGGACDERIGRFCLLFGSGTVADDDPGGWRPTPEAPEVGEARERFLVTLAEVGEAIPGDRWVLGHRVLYLGEAGRWEESLGLAAGCGLPATDGWLCRALEGVALDALGRFPEAEWAFDRALSEMPPEQSERWRGLDLLLPHDLRARFAAAEGDSLRALEARAWILADPLYLVPGNDRRSAHLSRRTQALLRSEARNPYGLRWGEDLTELLVRYGPEVAYEQLAAPALLLGPTPVVGRLDRVSRGVFPGADAFLDPAAILPGEWRVEDRAARERHAPQYAPRIEALEVQQARFRRGEAILLVLGWAGEVTADEGSAVEGGLFLRALPDLAPVEPTAILAPLDPGAGRGVLALRLPAGGYLVSLELLDREGARGWRARHGLRPAPVARGIPSLSDLLLLAPGVGGGEGPASDGDGATLEALLPRVLPSLRLPTTRVSIAWEVYEVGGVAGPLQFRLRAAPEGETLIRRAARFLRILDPDPAVEIAWEEAVPTGGGGDGGILLRTVEVELAALPPGPVRLTLTLELPGRSPIRAESSLELPR